jgi:hypothetical protein
MCRPIIITSSPIQDSSGAFVIRCKWCKKLINRFQDAYNVTEHLAGVNCKEKKREAQAEASRSNKRVAVQQTLPVVTKKARTEVNESQMMNRAFCKALVHSGTPIERVHHFRVSVAGFSANGIIFCNKSRHPNLPTSSRCSRRLRSRRLRSRSLF